jgi:SAM-dependent methyltransferase
MGVFGDVPNKEILMSETSVLHPAASASSTVGAFDNGRRGAFNAWFFDGLDRYISSASAHLKRVAFGGIRPGVVVEIGASVGANLGWIPRGTDLFAVEPNLRMHERLRRRCDAAGVRLHLIPARAELIPLPDGSADDVLCSLVLCTVEDPVAVIDEARRILKPGGRFRFVEHVDAGPRTPRGWVQRAVSRPWGWVFEGCDPHRGTDRMLEAAGFRDLTLIHRRLRRSVFYPVNTAIAGVAWR